jgi:glutarate dioxygenase
MADDIAEVAVRARPAADSLFSVTLHSHHPRLRHITFAQSVLEAFFDAVEDIDVQNLEYVPFMRFYLASVLRRFAGESFVTTINALVRDRATGGFTLGVQGARSDPSSFVKFGTAVGYLIGPGNHDAMSGTYYARFLVKDTDNSDSYLRQAYRLFTLHTDGTFVEEATDWLLMMKFSEENAKGGESRLLHIDDWAEADKYANDPRGQKNYLYKAPGSKNVSETVERPLFFQSEFGRSVSFIDQFVQPETIEDGMFLKAFSDSMESSLGTIETPLPVGDLVVVNNYFWLHGRAPFKKNPDLHRELMRQRGMFYR